MATPVCEFVKLEQEVGSGFLSRAIEVVDELGCSALYSFNFIFLRFG